jgi:NAD(P)-dependent dehydrogenase (short-subunit alcohol dehydrogenase family)
MSLKEYFDLKGKTVLVTGAARGLGKEIALSLARCEASVIISDIEYPQTTEQAIVDMGAGCMATKTDIADEDQLRDLAGRVAAQYGKPDILINNAGISQLSYTPTEDLPVEEWDNVLRVNLRGTFLCCKYLGKLMIDNGGGAIVNIASTAGITGVARAPAYCASKAGVILLTKSLALEWAGYNVRVNAIAPHYLKTDLTGGLRNSDEVYRKLIKQIPMKRFGETSEMVGAIIYLSSKASSYTTGAIITVDGGYLAQ